jgi:WD40 repeat protein
MQSIKHSSILVDQDSITSLSLFPNGDLISLSLDNTIHIWDGNTLICTKTITNDYDLNSLIILSDDNIATSCTNGIIKFWDTHDFRCIKTISLPKKYYLGQLFLLSNKNLACSFRLKTNNFTQQFETSIVIMDHNQDFKVIKTLHLQCSPMANLSENRLASVYRIGTIKIWDMLNKYKCIGTLTNEYQIIINSLLYVEKNDILLSACNDYSIKVWDVNDYLCIRTIIGHSSGVDELLLFKNGYFISCSFDGVMKVWDLNGFECVTL